MWKNRASKSLILQGFLIVFLREVRYLYLHPKFCVLFVYIILEIDMIFKLNAFAIKFVLSHEYFSLRVDFLQIMCYNIYCNNVFF